MLISSLYRRSVFNNDRPQQGTVVIRPTKHQTEWQVSGITANSALNGIALAGMNETRGSSNEQTVAVRWNIEKPPPRPHPRDGSSADNARWSSCIIMLQQWRPCPDVQTLIGDIFHNRRCLIAFQSHVKSVKRVEWSVVEWSGVEWSGVEWSGV